MNILKASVCLSALIGMAAIHPATAEESTSQVPNPRPGQPGHRSHIEWQGAYPTTDSLKKFRFVKSLPLPDGFLGNIAYDAKSGRLWLVSLGPPTNTKGPSRIYEVDPETGAVLAKADLPFQGDFGEPVYLNGYLYQGVFHESKIYKIMVEDRTKIGKIAGSIPVPTLIDLKLDDESHSYPFIEFGGMTATPEGNLLLHADDVGEFITISSDTGEIMHRSRTVKAIGGISGVADNHHNFLVLANSDPRGGYCALSFPPALSRSPEQRDISWAVLDGRNGQVLASIRTQNSRAYASTVKVLKHEDMAGSPYGKFTFLATGEEGLVELEWTPEKDSY